MDAKCPEGAASPSPPTVAEDQESKSGWSTPTTRETGSSPATSPEPQGKRSRCGEASSTSSRHHQGYQLRRKMKNDIANRLQLSPQEIEELECWTSPVKPSFYTRVRREKSQVIQFVPYWARDTVPTSLIKRQYYYCQGTHLFEKDGEEGSEGVLPGIPWPMIAYLLDGGLNTSGLAYPIEDDLGQAKFKQSAASRT